MQLVYFWVEKYGVLENQGINLNSGFYFEMIKNSDNYTLERKKERERKIPKNFFGEGIENVSCIIGENGSGKTTLIQAITEQRITQNQLSTIKSVSIFEENGELFWYKNFNEIKFNFESRELNEINLRNLKYIYFNNDLNTKIKDNGMRVKNISLRNDLKYIGIRKENFKKKIIYGNDWFEIYLKYIFRDLTIFLIENKNLIDNIPYEKFKNKIKAIKEKGEIVVSLTDQIYKEDTENYKKLFEKMGGSGNSLIDKFIEKIWEYICKQLLDNLKVNKSKKYEEKILNIKARADETLDEWFNKILQDIKKIIDISKKNMDPLTLTENEILLFEFLIKLLLTSKDLKIEKDYFVFNVITNFEIFNAINKRYRGYELFNLQYNVKFSSGEMSFLNLLVRLNNARPERNSQNKSVIVFIEELEVFMHPEWQRKIIKLILVLKKLISWMKNTNIQYIFTSHTPFLIGDIPGGNISYFKEGEIMRNGYETFGGNIYNILKEQFLMESCFGEFSKEKIKKIIKLLSKDENNNYKESEIEANKQEIEFVIDSIGEDLIRNKLKKMYDTYKEYKKNSRRKIKSGDIEEIRKFIENKGLLVDDVLNELK